MIYILILIFQFIFINVNYSQGETYLVMGTYAYFDLGNPQVNHQAYKSLREIESKLSDYIKTSEISKINQNAGEIFTRVSEITLNAIIKSIEISDRTYGYFDITIGALTINSKRLGKLSPDSANRLKNYKHIVIKDDSVFLTHKFMAIDLGGIGKGFAIENVYRTLKLRSGFISIGGDMKVWGHKRTLAVKDPIGGGSLVQLVNSKDVSLSTSGNYYQKHILSEDDSVVQVTVAHEDATYADAYATALFAMPKKLRDKFLSDNELGVLLLYKDGSIYMNQKFKDFFEIIIQKGSTTNQ